MLRHLSSTTTITTITTFMDPSDLNFGHLLFLLNNEVLKNKIRSIEKINKRIINIKNGIHFNEINIYIYKYN